MEITDKTTQSSKRTKSTRRRKSYSQPLDKITDRDRRRSFKRESSLVPPSHTYNTRRRRLYLQQTQKNRKETMDNNRQTEVNQESLPSFTNIPQSWSSFTSIPIKENNNFIREVSPLSKREINKRKAFPRRSLSPIDDSDMEIEPDTIFDPYEMNPVVTNLPPIHYIILMHGVTLENKIKIPSYNKRKIAIHFYTDEGNAFIMYPEYNKLFFKTLCFDNKQLIIPDNTVYSGNVIYDILLESRDDNDLSIGLYICDRNTLDLKLLRFNQTFSLLELINYIFQYHDTHYDKRRQFKITSINCRSYSSSHDLIDYHQKWAKFPTSYVMDDKDISNSEMTETNIFPNKFSHLQLNGRIKIWNSSDIKRKYSNYIPFMEDVLQELNNSNTNLFFHNEIYQTRHGNDEHNDIINLCKKLKESELVFLRFHTSLLNVEPYYYMLLVKINNRCRIYNKLTQSFIFFTNLDDEIESLIIPNVVFPIKINNKPFLNYVNDNKLYTFQILHEKI